MCSKWVLKPAVPHPHARGPLARLHRLRNLAVDLGQRRTGIRGLDDLHLRFAQPGRVRRQLDCRRGAGRETTKDKHAAGQAAGAGSQQYSTRGGRGGGGGGGGGKGCAPVFTHLISLTLILVAFAATRTRRHLCTRPAKGSCAARSRLLSFTWVAIYKQPIPLRACGCMADRVNACRAAG